MTYMAHSVEDQLKREILRRYRSIRSFTQVVGLPYSTIDNIFKRGIGGTAVTTVVKVFRALDLDLDSIDRGILCKEGDIPLQNFAIRENERKERLLNNYAAMNGEGQEMLTRLSDDMVAGRRYAREDDKIAYRVVARSQKDAPAMEGKRFDPDDVSGIDGEDF